MISFLGWPKFKNLNGLQYIIILIYNMFSCLSCFVCDQCRVTHQLTVDLEISFLFFVFFFFEARTSFVWHRISVEPRKLFLNCFSISPADTRRRRKRRAKKKRTTTTTTTIKYLQRKEKRLAQEERRQIGSRVNRRLSLSPSLGLVFRIHPHAHTQMSMEETQPTTQQKDK